MQIIYIIGAQCTGKTTLCKALKDEIEMTHPRLKCQLLSETARQVLNLHGFTREDVREGGSRCLQLQQLILNRQLEAEKRAFEQETDVIISDRSGLDALVYAEMFCGPESAAGLLNSDAWHQLKLNLVGRLMIVCEPVQEWLRDDGVRAMPADWSEWLALHKLFLQKLQQYNIDHTILPANVRLIQDRVALVQALVGLKKLTYLNGMHDEKR